MIPTCGQVVLFAAAAEYKAALGVDKNAAIFAHPA
jgi:hypothetical protein